MSDSIYLYIFLIVLDWYCLSILSFYLSLMIRNFHWYDCVIICGENFYERKYLGFRTIIYDISICIYFILITNMILTLFFPDTTRIYIKIWPIKLLLISNLWIVKLLLISNLFKVKERCCCWGIWGISCNVL